MKTFVTKNSKETQELGKNFARKLKSGGILCLEGNLGAGKTTFTQGFLKELKAKGPYTSPTFLVIKNYKKEIPISKSQLPNKSKKQKIKFQNIYHIDTYRVDAKDILNLGWEEIIGNKNNIVIVEWADRIKKIIPKKSVWLKFEWMDENERKIIVKK
jgi:tRNA threonylcarbamoyladenosine biosynthesis protein TsaE